MVENGKKKYDKKWPKKNYDENNTVDNGKKMLKGIKN